MRVLESAIYAENLEETAAFYADVLGLERIAAAEGRHVFFRSGDGVVLIFRPSATQEPPARDARVPVPPHGATGAGHLCFAASADEIERWRARLGRAGVAIEADFDWPQGGRSIYFRDPAGNSIEMAEPRIWGLDPGD
jgi:catechol 2,3-dioxygenase-like lactoylglutathione lyase family enzyme